MNADALEAACREVYRRFPEFRGIAPKVERTAAKRGGRAALIFRTRVRLPNGNDLPRWLRAVCTDEGQVIRITTSR